ncbi:unnamed protein product [Mycena citricolor]|uniref:F-box domain-containing protein n=1 Tax=Mycena citricolor TaxID=2018698 RepID=A0AAD2HCA5_9AGAR|nr:unnamed protein product [Mycena citricolor]
MVATSRPVPPPRRRSLQALAGFLLQPLSGLDRHVGFASTTTLHGTRGGPSDGIPVDILLEVVSYLDPEDVLNVSLTSSFVRSVLEPGLYHSVQLRSSTTCRSGLDLLSRRPQLCRYVQRLAVRPNYYLAWPVRDECLREDDLSDTICRLAPRLTNLRSFDWDGLEMPADRVWRALRLSCPSLTEVYTNLGCGSLDPQSELFKFSDLTVFSLSVRHGLGDGNGIPLVEELPAQLWDMLLDRCKNLRELTLCSFSASQRLLDVDRAVQGRWPQLTSLTLGAYGYNSDLSVAAPSAVDFGAFLAAHPALTYLRVAWNFRHWPSPIESDSFAVTLPAGLETLSGIMQQLPMSLSNSNFVTPRLEQLTCLDLMCEPLYLSRAAMMCSALAALPQLTSLELWVHLLDPKAGHEDLFRSLWKSAPKLEELHFMCTTAFGRKPLSELARSLRLLPALRTFALTKGHRYADESMRSSALRIYGALAPPADAAAAPLPSLTSVSIRWARAVCRNHLKQEGTYERVCQTDQARAPPAAVHLQVWERGIRAVGGPFERRHRVPLGKRWQSAARDSPT